MRKDLDIRENNTYSESLIRESNYSKILEMDKLKEEIDILKKSEAHAMGLLSDSKRKIQQLEAELDKRNESEANLFDSLVMQTKQLEQSKILLEESKIEIASLREKLEAFSTPKNTPDESQDGLLREESVKVPETEVQEGEKLASMKATTLREEIGLLKIELKLATEAEEKSKKAMDDLALALKEVAIEASLVKDRLTLSQMELQNSKGEAERLRMMLKSSEVKYKEFLDETRKEADLYKNTAERLRLEAEESLLAWNMKETELVNCIRRVEGERSAAQKEATTLLESIKVEENRTKLSKEENQKLRDILKQALNEANVAKEAAGIAGAENSQLQDSLAEKEESLNLLSHENEMLKIHEAAAFENINELKRLLSETFVKEEISSTNEANKEEKEMGRKANGDRIRCMEMVVI